MSSIFTTSTLCRSRNGPAAEDPPNEAPLPERPERPDWERALAAPLEQNCAAPSDEAILYAFDLYCDALYAPFHERQHAMAELHADIAADVAALQALAPDLLERAMARHPVEFAHILDHKETRR